MNRQWVLVTGGSRGIGQALVQELAQRWNVIFTWCNREQASRDTINSCAGLPGWVKSYHCDGTDQLAVEHLAQKLLVQHGAPVGIVHNAGVTQDKLHIHQEGDLWRQVMETNLNAVFYWNKQLLPAMMALGEGALVLMSSVSGIRGNPGQTAYGASKAAMVGLSRSLAQEIGRFGLRVNCLLPGIIESDMTRAIPPEQLKTLRKAIPLRRVGKALEVAKVAAFMLGEDSRYMTGQTIVLDGGLTA